MDIHKFHVPWRLYNRGCRQQIWYRSHDIFVYNSSDGCVMTDLINARDWKRYLKWVASENEKIDKIRKDQLDKWKAENEERRKKSKEWEAKEKLRNEAYMKELHRRTEAYDNTP